jgi:hypothetical protein
MTRACHDAETTGKPDRTSAMDRRDIIMMVAVLLLALAATWAGTDYVVNQIVLPLVEDEPTPSPSYPSP